ncbi:hypothetical protein GUJ93_ZPchr0013g37017 [Zizania palustris]|nr:hypothetical protein GUJ93_ZPchr0013g37017 [Zizania palustris]
MSFNQTGGICALCFLELVDRKVGKDHLLKRSVILIKAWCYYESRLLGAHHGLISTYALETLILYIFNLFHKSLHSPLEVLYRFLEYFSKFDWDNYCISLNGPVALSSLPNQIVEATNAPGHDLLFDKEFLKNSACKTLLPPIDSKACYTIFRVKYLNIIDPLKEHNNLGRSVNKASFNRIRIAFSYGARKLGQVLLLPLELIPDEIYGFFKNTLNRNGNGVRPDINNESYDGALHYQYPLFYQENGNGNSEQYTNPEMVEQSVKEASSDCKVIRDSFDIPTLSTMSDIDVNVMLPGLLSPSSTETDERRLSPVSSHSTEYFSQQSQDEGNWENSVPWYHSSDDIPSLHGTGPHILQKHIASLADNDKILINQQARVKNNQASAPKGNSATYEASARCKVQAVLDTGTKDLKISGYLKVQDNGHEHMSTNKKIDNYSCDTCKECVRPEDEAEIPKYYKHVRSSKNSLENQIYDIDTGFARSDIAMKQIPKYQPLKIQDMSNQCICPTRNLTGYQGFNVQKRQEIHNWPRKQTTVCEPLKRPNSLHGRACSNKKSIAKHIPSYQANSNKESEIVGKSRRLLPRAQISHCDNKRQTMFAASTCQPSLPDTKGYSPSGDLETPPLEETIEFGTLGPFSLTFMSPVSKKATNTLSTSKACANAAASVLQSRLTQSRSPGFYKIGDEDHFPPLHAGTR